MVSFSASIPSAPIAGVRVALAPLSLLDAVRPRAYAALSAAERERLAQASDARADEVLLGRWLLRSLAAGAGDEPEDVVVAARCPTCGREHGAPTLPGRELLASITHSGGLVVAAVAQRQRWAGLGIDTEPIGAHGLAERELRRWTELEARAKARGTGIVEIDDDDEPGRWVIERLPTPGFVTTLAVLASPLGKGGAAARAARRRTGA